MYAAVFIDAIMVKVRDGQVRNRPFYAAIGVDLDGHKDILGMWAGDGDGESAKFWMAVLTELKNRGVQDVFFVVCDGLKGLPDRVNAVFPLATVQTCIIHLIRNTFRYASRRVLGPDRQGPQTDLPGRHPARRPAAFEAFEDQVGQAVPGDHQAVALGVGRVHPVPGLRRRDPPRDLLHQRDRVPERPLPPGGPGPRALPERAGRDEDACTWSPDRWTRRAPVRHDGP